MIDIHSHLLFSVDDGCDDITTSIKLIKEAKAKGVTDVIITPHKNVVYKTTASEIKEKFLQLKTAIDNEGVLINLYLGQEILEKFFDEEKLLNGELLSLSDSKYVLMEYYFDRPSEIVESVYSLSRIGLKPIVAHYEKVFMPSIMEAYEIKQNGGLIQIDATSLFHGGVFKKFAKKLLKEDLVDFIASDMHQDRVNEIDRAYKYVERKFGKDRAERLFKINAEKIIKG